MNFAKIEKVFTKLNIRNALIVEHLFKKGELIVNLKISKILIRLAVGLLILALQGCSKTVEGEVFLVNSNGTSERLSLVKIYQLNVDQVEEFRRSLDASGKQMGRDLTNALSKIDLESLDKQLQLIDAADNKKNSVLQRCEVQRGHMAYCLDLIRGLVETQVEVDSAVRRKLALIAASFKSLEGTPSTPIAFIAKEAESYAGTNNITPTKTNSDGKFTIQLTSKDNRLLAVPDSGQVKSHSIWFIDGSQTEKSLILSNDNQVGTNCKECVALEIANETKKVIEQTEKLVSCYKRLTEILYECKANEFVDLVRKMKTIKLE